MHLLLYSWDLVLMKIANRLSQRRKIVRSLFILSKNVCTNLFKLSCFLLLDRNARSFLFRWYKSCHLGNHVSQQNILDHLQYCPWWYLLKEKRESLSSYEQRKKRCVYLCICLSTYILMLHRCIVRGGRSKSVRSIVIVEWTLERIQQKKYVASVMPDKSRWKFWVRKTKSTSECAFSHTALFASIVCVLHESFVLMEGINKRMFKVKVSAVCQFQKKKKKASEL